MSQCLSLYFASFGVDSSWEFLPWSRCCCCCFSCCASRLTWWTCTVSAAGSYITVWSQTMSQELRWRPVQVSCHPGRRRCMLWVEKRTYGEHAENSVWTCGCVCAGVCSGRLRRSVAPQQRRVLRLFLQPLDGGDPHEGGRELSSGGQLRQQALRHRRRSWRQHLFW